MPSVGISIVTHNSPLAALQRAVESLTHFPGGRPVVVDNASSADYRARLRELCGGKAELLENPANSGFGAGHNLAARSLGNVKYLAVVNPDVVVPNGTLETMIEYMEAHHDVALLAPKILNEDGTIQPQNKRNPTVLDLFIRRFMPEHWFKKRRRFYSMIDVGYDEICEPEFISGCFMVFRKEVFDEIGGFDERFFLYFEDADITRRVRKEGRAIYFPGVSVTHGWARGAHKSRKLMLIMIASAWKYFNKWGWKFL